MEVINRQKNSRCFPFLPLTLLGCNSTPLLHLEFVFLLKCKLAPPLAPPTPELLSWLRLCKNKTNHEVEASQATKVTPISSNIFQIQKLCLIKLSPITSSELAPLANLACKIPTRLFNPAPQIHLVMPQQNKVYQLWQNFVEGPTLQCWQDWLLRNVFVQAEILSDWSYIRF